MSSCVGIVVDGLGDYRALRKRLSHGFRIVKTDGPRGDKASPKDIALRSGRQIGILRKFGCAKVVIVLDFESRPQTYEGFVQTLRTSFSGTDFGLPVSVAVPNRMIENWYLADIEYLSAKKAFLKAKLKQKRYEGRDGKSLIKRCMRPPHTYSETEHGPEMFAILRFHEARKNSPSLDAFLTLIRRS